VYECSVLRGLRGGRILAEDALAMVERALFLYRSVRGRVPGTEGLWKDVHRVVENTAHWRRANSDLLLDLLELRAVLTKIEPKLDPWKWETHSG
jgi:hypothetical protein